MQVGDPKKTAFLAIVAVAAIGFCVKQVFGGESTPKVLRQAAGADAGAGAGANPGVGGATPNATVAMLQLDDLRVDPFSHPRLAPKNPNNPNAAQPNGSVPGLGGPDKPVDHSDGGGTPLPPPFGGGPIGITKDPAGDWPKPVDPGQKPADVVKVEKLTQISLKGIVKVNQRIAYLTVDGQDARGYRAGDLIKNDIQVMFVNEDSVIVKSSKSTVTLKVGQQGDL